MNQIAMDPVKKKLKGEEKTSYYPFTHPKCYQAVCDDA